MMRDRKIIGNDKSMLRLDSTRFIVHRPRQQIDPANKIFQRQSISSCLIIRSNREEEKSNSESICVSLFSFVLFCFVLFCFVLFCSVLLCSIIDDVVVVVITRLYRYNESGCYCYCLDDGNDGVYFLVLLLLLLLDLFLDDVVHWW